MKRRKPLRRGGPLKRKSALKVKTGTIKARPKPKRSRVEQQASEIWWSVIVARGCEVCPKRGEICDGRLQSHHVVTQQALKKRSLAHLTWDLDVGLCVCERAHRRHHSRHQPIERSLLRPENLAFAERHGLLDLIERFYP